MTVVPLDLVKDLRERTGAGMMDCKAALESTGGDMEKAIDILRKKGLSQAAKRAGREAKEGFILVRQEGGKAALVEINCETDFVARTDDFKGLGLLALQEVFARGENGLSVEKVTQRVADLSGKIGEKIMARRAKVVETKDRKPHEANWAYIRNQVRDQIGEFLFQRTERRPMVLPVVIEV